MLFIFRFFLSFIFDSYLKNAFDVLWEEGAFFLFIFVFFFDSYLKDAFDVLWEEGATAPKMMSIGK
jgi:hypothetical protein